MILEQFLINKTKEIDNPISNWGIGFTAEVIREWIDLQVKVKKLTIPIVKNWVAVKERLPDNCDQVFVKYENGKYGINEWWESDDCWKYQFDNMIVKEWCKPPCS